MSYNRWFRWAALQSQDILFAPLQIGEGKVSDFSDTQCWRWGGGGREEGKEIG